MTTLTDRDGRSGVRSRALQLATLAVAGLLCWPGCATKKSLTITRDEYINNEMFIDRQMPERTGNPLDLAIVLVYPNDLKVDANSRLRPGSGITSKEWYEKCPTPAGTAGRFQLPSSQVKVYTNDSDVFGDPIGRALNGTRVDGTTPATCEFDFKQGMNSADAAIYVFGRFTDKDGALMPVPPAVFSPPGKYPKDLKVRIGVDWSRTGMHQFFENLTPAK